MRNSTSFSGSSSSAASVCQLILHHGRAADLPDDGQLAHYHAELGRISTSQNFVLSPAAELNATGPFPLRVVRSHGREHRVDVALGLKESGDQVRLEELDLGGVPLELVEPEKMISHLITLQHVLEAAVPFLGPAVLGQLQQFIEPRLRGIAVERHQVADIPGVRHPLAVLQTADLRRRALERAGGVLDQLSGRLAQAAKFASQAAPRGGGAACQGSFPPSCNAHAAGPVRLTLGRHPSVCVPSKSIVYLQVATVGTTPEPGRFVHRSSIDLWLDLADERAVAHEQRSIPGHRRSG